MSNKRILLIHEDRLVTNLYREKLEGSGFTIDTTRHIEQAQRLIEQKKPDAIVVDLVLQTGTSITLIESLRNDPNTMGLPILVFPNSLTQLSSDAINAGANAIISRGKQPIGMLIDAAKRALGMDGLGDAIDAELFSPDEGWVQTLAGSDVESINQMRHCIPGLVSVPFEVKTLHTLWVIAHALYERAQFLDNPALIQFASAFDHFLADLNAMPEQLNPSTLRTIGQAIDFLAVLGNANTDRISKDAASSQILVVDDEDSAAQFISAAMQLAGLKNEVASSPTAAMEKLNGTPNDLIFLDVGLPEMSGFDLCQKIRAHDAHKKTPIVFLTGMATFQNKAQASLSGGNDFVGKPFNLPELGVKALLWLFRGQLGMV